MYQTLYSKILNIAKKNPMIILVVLLSIIPVAAALADTPTGSNKISTTPEIKYIDPNGNNSITFYSDGTFFIDQKTDLVGTYIETPCAYGITYTDTGFGKTINKVSNGIEVPDETGMVEIWNKV